MRVAILGASSEIAKDFAHSSRSEHVLYKYARRPMYSPYTAFNCFHDYNWDAIINFVGVGDPDKIKALGPEIFNITDTYDQLALDYCKVHPECKYIFISSGAAASPKNAYGAAKRRAELMHRYLNLPIVDVRVWSYFSHTQDVMSSFFMTDVVRAIRDERVLRVSGANNVRDYCGPDDFYRLISGIFTAPPTNCCVDLYSKHEVDKFTLLNEINDKYKFGYVVNNDYGYDRYYPMGSTAEAPFGYKPQKTSLENVMHELALCFP